VHGDTAIARQGDVLAIMHLKARYFRLLDTKAWDQWRRLFADDMYFFAEETPVPEATEPTVCGADAFVLYVSEMLATAVTVHHGHMPEITVVDSHSAAGVWAMFDWVDNVAKGYALHGFGHYHERYRKNAAGQWQITELRLTRLRVDLAAPTEYGNHRVWPPAWTPAQVDP
jgi:SnoaL-like protein